jgi:pyridinium-3,5-biscarboxylic acid mononucleotide sulfurtransferase
MIDSNWKKLEERLKNYNSVLIAYSGGVDSTLLTKISFDILGNKALAVTAYSTLNTEKELKEAEEIARKIGIKHLVINTEELKNSKFAVNDKDRCSYCKNELFSKLKKIAAEHNLENVIEASNFNDLSDYRPGMKVSNELGIIQPFVLEKITKDEIRKKAKEFGLSNWNKPSSPCLSSRIPYGEVITEKKLRMIEKAEDFLKTYNFYNVRVRVHNDLARIEVNKKDFNKIIKKDEEIIKKFKEIGFIFVSLDLQGFRSGSLNEGLGKNK